MKPKLIYYDCLNYTRQSMQALEDYFQVIALPTPGYNTPDILEDAVVIIAPLGYYCNSTVMDMAPGLRIIGSNTTAAAHIDTIEATRREIGVITLAGYPDMLAGITPTAELTIGLMIALTRQIIPAASSTKTGSWDRWPYAGKQMLSRSTLGIVGHGRLGKMVHKAAEAMGMTVKWYDPHVWVRQKYNTPQVHDLGDLAAQVDILTLHVPLTLDTAGMINEGIIERMKPGGYIINTSRGEVINQMDVIMALKSEQLAGVAMDVLPGEFEPGFNPERSPIWRYALNHDNVILTPHIGGSTEDAWGETQQFIIDKVKEALAWKY